jgi:hypothetical protein
MLLAQLRTHELASKFRIDFKDSGPLIVAHPANLAMVELLEKPWVFLGISTQLFWRNFEPGEALT